MNRYDPSTVYHPLTVWNRECLNPNFQNEMNSIIAAASDRSPDAGVMTTWIIRSYFPIQVARMEIDGKSRSEGKITEGLDLPDVPTEEEHSDRESFGFHVWMEKIRISLGPPPTLSGINRSGYANLFRYVYRILHEKTINDDLITVYKDRDTRNNSPENIFEIHVADAITLSFLERDHDMRGHIEIFDDSLLTDPTIKEFLAFSSCVFWYFLGLVENSSKYPIQFWPGVFDMPNANEWFNTSSFCMLQRAKAERMSKNWAPKYLFRGKDRLIINETLIPMMES